MNSLKFAALAAAALMITGCASKEEPAKQVVASAEAGLTEVRADAEKFAAEELQAAQAALARAKEDLARKNYKEVIAAAPQLEQGVARVRDTVVSRRTQQAAAAHEFERLKEQLPKQIAAIEVRVKNLKGARLPKEVSKESFEAATASLETIKSTWAEATAAFDAGDATVATDKGLQVEAAVIRANEQLALNPV